ncbi:PAS domain-containing protein [Fodinibius sediminis]|uniref:PAS domain S-box-containing protein n=1 Tax=Fodinibius sediminis TaxID=1214077 RepID=A0A521AEX1_9BACT|nr:PAS domain-containing protein [Fodinibius sediminis]SMO33353.1 PAS domain S-box-containing protein [Fodinibius sediminis]
MLPDDLKNLRDLCKDEQSFEKIKKSIASLVEERDKTKHQLSLLEAAIKDDYESILITELNLEEPGPEIVYVNDGFCEITGYSREEVMGKTPRILQGPKTDREVLDKLKERLINGQCFFGQAINYRKDGSEFVNQWDIHPLTNEEGVPTHWVSYQHDITERKRAEQQFIDTKIEFDELREESYCTAIDIDSEGNVISANNAFAALTGYTKDELKDCKVWEFFPDKYTHSLKKRFTEDDGESLLNGKEFKALIKHKSGLPIQVKGQSRVLDLKDQQVIRVEIENISLQKKVMDSLRKRHYNLNKETGNAE